MRTTVTLDADSLALIRRSMEERGLSFKDAVNQAIRAGLGETRDRKAPFRTPTFSLGGCRVPLDKALTLAGDLEDEEIAREIERRR